mmetsp:Transcript_56578/g.148502  ORF Transcript_56578/g.148502 Transcript_56578/m.148502 type:complete len:322 (+) Transcript_56578:309-1274(+)
MSMSTASATTSIAIRSTRCAPSRRVAASRRRPAWRLDRRRRYRRNRHLRWFWSARLAHISAHPTDVSRKSSATSTAIATATLTTARATHALRRRDAASMSRLWPTSRPAGCRPWQEILSSPPKSASACSVILATSFAGCGVRGRVLKTMMLEVDAGTLIGGSLGKNRVPPNFLRTSSPAGTVSSPIGTRAPTSLTVGSVSPMLRRCWVSMPISLATATTIATARVSTSLPSSGVSNTIRAATLSGRCVLYVGCSVHNPARRLSSRGRRRQSPWMVGRRSANAADSPTRVATRGTVLQTTTSSTWRCASSARFVRTQNNCSK